MTALVQPSISGFSPSTGTYNVSFAQPPQAGNIVIVGALNADHIVDNVGNPYSVLIGTQLHALSPVPRQAGRTLTVSVSLTPNAVWAAEFAPDPGFMLQFSNSLGGSGSSHIINAPSIAVAKPSTLLFCTCFYNGIIQSADPPWTGVGSVQNGDWAEFVIPNTVPVVVFTAFTGNVNANWTTTLAAFLSLPLPAVPAPTGPGTINKSVQFATDTVPYIGGVLETTRRNPS